MKPTYLKRQGKCGECKLPIQKGTPCIQLIFKMGEHWGKVHYHFEPCFVEKMRKYFVEHPPSTAPSGCGRRRKSIFNVKRRSLLSLLIYHRKLGHKERVAEIDKKIKELEGMTFKEGESK